MLRERSLAKVWLDPVEAGASTRFSSHELREIVRLVVENNEEFMEAWNELHRHS
ncbi:MAG TPA: DUF4160 domain-containing protein [Thermoanaerobaculia bacterium]|nr:DUF4160 domain-containing protein [Thermoanaerobaculia bacterium]